MKFFKVFFVPWAVAVMCLFPVVVFGDITLVQELTSSPRDKGNINRGELEEQEDEVLGSLQDLEDELKDLKRKLSIAKNNIQRSRIQQSIEELEQLIAQRKEEVTDSQSYDGGFAKEQVTVYISGNKLRVDARGVVSIIDLDRNLMLNLELMSKTYHEIPFEALDQMQKRLEEATANLPSEKQKELTPRDIKVALTENKQKINGFNCQQYVITDQMGSEEVWVTQDVEFKEYSALMKKYSHVMLRGNPEVQRELEKLHIIEGIPIKVISRSPDSVEVTEVKSISTDKLDPALFQVPQGFQKYGLKKN